MALLLISSLAAVLSLGLKPAASGRAQALPTGAAGGRPPPAAGRRPPAPARRRLAAAAAPPVALTEARPATADVRSRDEARLDESTTGVAPKPSAALGPWTLEHDGFELLPLPLELGDGSTATAERLAIEAGAEMSVLASRWRPIKNGDDSLGRRQSYLRMRKHRAPLGLAAAAVVAASERAAKDRLGEDFVLNDCVAIADFDPELPRQELHRDIRRDAHSCSTHGLLAPLAKGARLHLVPGSHKPRGGLRGDFAHAEVMTVHVQPGQLLLWDGMLVHAGDGGQEGFEHGVPNRLRLHAYVERVGEDRPYDDKGDRSIIEAQ